MQLKPEIDLAFENVFSMSGMPDQQHLGYINATAANSDNNNEDIGIDALRASLYGEDKLNNNALKRNSDDDITPLESAHKRSKADSGFKNDFTAGFQQGGMSQFSSQGGMESNLFNADLQRAAFAQQQMELNSMSNTMNRNTMNLNSMAGMGMNNQGALAGAGIGRMERRMEQETNRQQQQNAMLANEMALMSQMSAGMSNQFGNSDSMRQQQAFNSASAAQRSQLFGDNSDLFNQNNPNSNSFAMPSDLQGFSQMSSMNSQPFLSNMLDFSRMNNRRNQGLGGFNGGTLPPFSTSLHQQQMNLSNQAMNQLQAGGFGSGNASSGNNAMSSFLNGGGPTADAMPSISPMEAMQLRRMNNNNGPSSPQQQQSSNAIVPQQQPSNRAAMENMVNISSFAQRQAQVQQRPNQLLQQLDTCQPVLPPLEEANTPHYSQRPYSPFSVDEDPNWLSEFQCFIRSEILELFRVSQQGIKVRNALKSLTVNQVGIRCRFCAHLQHGTRANRASCFPSKIDKIYQSFTMMLREHFPSCSEIPEAQKQRFMQLQNMNAQGASNAKGFWEHAAKKKGLVDIAEENGRGGIHIFESTLTQAALIAPFGAESRFQEPQPPVTLIHPNDRGLVSPFLYALMEQVYRVHLAPSERKGNRKSLRPGMPGFGCRYCYEAGRMGLCRLFPARRRTIHTKIPDLFDHMKRCPLCPQQVKENLVQLHNDENNSLDRQSSEQDTASRGREREFFERIWARLGHQDDTE